MLARSPGAARGSVVLKHWLQILGVILVASSRLAMAEGQPRAQDDSAEQLPEIPPAYETTITTDEVPKTEVPHHRGHSEVTRSQLQQRLPRSTPDALRYEPGVFVQQTGHGQGSAFIRGLTGQQTLLLFDGIRLNNSTFRQGPNQYLFSLDSQTVHSLQILRGGASTRYGSDALGGVILAKPIEPILRPAAVDDPVTVEPHWRARAATADEELGGRAQLHLTGGDAFAFLGGVGGRTVSSLMSSGAITGVAGGEALVPRFAEDGRTQLGTGFEELTADGRMLYQPSPNHAFKLAAYLYRQYDAPRTDKCPAANAPEDDCLSYDEQFRTLVYGVWEGTPNTAGLAGFRATLSWQQQHERRTDSRPSSLVEEVGRDTVNTLGVTWVGETRAWPVTPWLKLKLEYGGDTYHDRVQSAAWSTFSNIDVTHEASRGQYLDGSSYTYGGIFTTGTARLFDDLRLRAGGRLSWVVAAAPADLSSGSLAIDRFWLPLSSHGGVEWRAVEWLHLLANADYSFRAPNLDDLTARQQTGPGFQYENPTLRPETATTFEIGARTVGSVQAELWGFVTLLDGAVIKNPLPASDCQTEIFPCGSARSHFRLVNAEEPSLIAGTEAAILIALPGGLSGRATVAWTWGEGPNTGDPDSVPTVPSSERVPLSRIPPLNGTLELLWSHVTGASAGASLRWAATQDRLALADVSDARIPPGGTPGFAVLDLRMGYRIEEKLLLSLVMENVFDTPYRYHGSSVNGPGRGMVILLDVGPVWRP